MKTTLLNFFFFFQHYLGWVMSKIAVGEVAKAMRKEGENKARQSTDSEKSNLLFNEDILKLCSES
jgi:hypothetical protein